MDCVGPHECPDSGFPGRILNCSEMINAVSGFNVVDDGCFSLVNLPVPVETQKNVSPACGGVFIPKSVIMDEKRTCVETKVSTNTNTNNLSPHKANLFSHVCMMSKWRPVTCLVCPGLVAPGRLVVLVQPVLGTRRMHSINLIIVLQLLMSARYIGPLMHTSAVPLKTGIPPLMLLHLAC